MHTYLLHHLLSDSAKRYPDKKAIIFEEKSITYSDLEKKSNQLSSVLFKLGVKVGDRVGIILNKSIESIISIFGVLKTGAIYVPIDPLAPLNRVKYIIGNCEIKCLITSSQNITKIISNPDTELPPLTKVIVTQWNSEIATNHDRNMEFMSWEEIMREASENFYQIGMADINPAYILYTSGSTGLPKGVMISHLNALTFVNMAANFFEITKNDRLCSHAPIHFDLSVFDIYVAVKNGSTIVLIPEVFSMFPIKLAQFIENTKISVWNSVASVLSLLAERGQLEKFRFDSLRLVLFSGEVLPVKYLRKLMTQMKKAHFFNIYGQTEANSSMVYPINEIPDDDAWRMPIGKTFPNFEVFALDEHSEIIKSPKKVGELYVRGSTVAMGYWGDTERTSKAFVQDSREYLSQNRIYKTGDLVEIDDHGNYIFLGRQDHQVKSRGYRIQLDEIEIVLNNHSEIKEAVVIAIPDELVGNRIVSYVSFTDGTKVTEMEIFDYCSTSLPRYMVPEKITFLDKLPKTLNGKIDRKLLKEIACGSVLKI